MKIIFILFVKCGMAGVVGTACHYLIFAIAYNMFGANVMFSTSLGAIVGAVVNHILNHYIVFKARGSMLATARAFYMVALSGMALNFAIMYTLTEILNISAWTSQIASTVVVFCAGFLANKAITFSGKFSEKKL